MSSSVFYLPLDRWCPGYPKQAMCYNSVAHKKYIGGSERNKTKNRGFWVSDKTGFVLWGFCIFVDMPEFLKDISINILSDAISFVLGFAISAFLLKKI